MDGEIFCSVIIPTIGRSSLDRSVISVLNQEFDQADYEVVVVNDSGQPLSDADWHSSARVQILNTNRRERSFSRNSGAAVARGEYLGFLDDDDWYLPGALEAFWLLAQQHPQAVWFYGGIQIVDEMENCLAEINSGFEGNCFAQIIGGAWAPLQTSLIQTRAFFQTGGFNPAICGTEDEDLCRKIAYLGDFANTSAILACLYRGQNWSSSTNYLRATEDTRLSRNLILSEKNSFTRLFASANSSYWFGRICKIYLSLVAWNFRYKRFFEALSRGFLTIASFIHSGIHIFAREFWDGFRAHHVPNTLHFVMKAYEKQHIVMSDDSSVIENKD